MGKEKLEIIVGCPELLQPLTDYEISRLWLKVDRQYWQGESVTAQIVMEFARLIEKAHGIRIRDGKDRDTEFNDEY